MVRHEFITENLELIKKLVRSGDMDGAVLARYKMYLVYVKQDRKKKKMQRYEDTAKASGCGFRTVMRAVDYMLVKI